MMDGEHEIQLLGEQSGFSFLRESDYLAEATLSAVRITAVG